MEKKWGVVEDGIIFVHLYILLLQMALIYNIFITKHFIALQLKGTWPFLDLTDSTTNLVWGIDFWLYQTLYLLNLVGKMLCFLKKKN